MSSQDKCCPANQIAQLKQLVAPRQQSREHSKFRHVSSRKSNVIIEVHQGRITVMAKTQNQQENGEPWELWQFCHNYLSIPLSVESQQ